jgi:hypothetical protein
MAGFVLSRVKHTGTIASQTNVEIIVVVKRRPRWFNTFLLSGIKHMANPTWVKGQSGNPSGRPRSKPITDELKRIGEEGGYEALAKKLFSKAIAGDVRAAQEVLNRVEGKVTDRITVEAGTTDLISLLTRKATDNGKGTKSTDDTDIPGDAGNADDDRADA